MFSVNSVQQLELELPNAMADKLFYKIQQKPFFRRALLCVGTLIAYREHLVTKFHIAGVFRPFG